MSKSTISTFELFQMFPDQESARLYLESRLWPDGATCPTCKKGERITVRKGGYYRCNACNLDFTVRTGTVMDRSHIPLHKWLGAMLLVAKNPDISSLALASELELTPKSASLTIKRIYEAATPLLEKHLELDKSFFRLIDEWEGYRVGSDGSIWTRRRKGNTGRPLSFVWRPLNPTFVSHGNHPKGRRVVTLHNQGRKRWAYVHDLVCEAFHGKCPAGMECRHLDGDSTNDVASNLKWGTSAENSADTVLHGRSAKGEQNGNSKLTDDEIAEIRTMKGVAKRRVVAEKFHISITYVSYLWSGKFRKVSESVGGNNAGN